MAQERGVLMEMALFDFDFFLYKKQEKILPSSV